MQLIDIAVPSATEKIVSQESDTHSSLELFPKLESGAIRRYAGLKFQKMCRIGSVMKFNALTGRIKGTLTGDLAPVL